MAVVINDFEVLPEEPPSTTGPAPVEERESDQRKIQEPEQAWRLARDRSDRLRAH